MKHVSRRPTTRPHKRPAMRRPLSEPLGGDLTDFETFVQSQQPATTPWTPITDYRLEARRAVEGRHPQLIQEVFQPTSVLDAGCGPDGILVKLLYELGIEARGFDPLIVTPSVKPHLFNGILSASPPVMSRDADLVVCREVLEHLTVLEIVEAVRTLCALTTRFVYVTTRFSSEHDLLRVATRDDLDPTHISLPSKDFVRLLFVLEGLRQRADLENRMDHLKKERVLVYEWS